MFEIFETMDIFIISKSADKENLVRTPEPLSGSPLAIDSFLSFIYISSFS